MNLVSIRRFSVHNLCRISLMGEYLSRREYEKSRKALRSAVAAALKKLARVNGWRFAQGSIFREQGGWFVEVRGEPWIGENRTTAEFRAKPMALDPVFWQIVKTPENATQPLSFRLFGAWTCQGPVWSETQIPEEGEAESIALQILDWANDQATNPPMPFEAHVLAKFIEDQPEGRGLKGGWLAELVTLLALAGRLDEARAMCITAINNSESGGYSVGEKSFPELALDWIANKSHQSELPN